MSGCRLTVPRVRGGSESGGSGSVVPQSNTWGEDGQDGIGHNQGVEKDQKSAAENLDYPVTCDAIQRRQAGRCLSVQGFESFDNDGVRRARGD